ncbi:OTU domain-containing protein [Cephalotus follicularis]|uniref:Ubiquitin thioesterase OTU n=1 Tax=Cephalotus follicularis TaxID=3775 RepID=A0A1Q3B7J0_CEPFO|nr:OTU domain-containing protein [Cephalotus follicularis]
MAVCTPISTCARNVVYLSGQIASNLCTVVFRGPSSSCHFCLYPRHPGTRHALSASKASSCLSVNGFQTFQGTCFGSGFSQHRNNCCSLTVKGLNGFRGLQRRRLEISFACRCMNTRLEVPKHRMLPKIKCSMVPISWPKGCASAGLIFGLLVCCANSEPVHAEAAQGKNNKEDGCDLSDVKLSHGKKVYTDYSVIGIPGDGRCLFRSVSHEACLRSGKSAPNESLQRELADDLRARVADEFIKRREDTEWFVEGDFDTYVSQIRKPNVWGGEPELFMASHVLQMPITVYMYDKNAGGLIAIAEYGQEYGKENPINVLYHGFGHYDALHIHGERAGKSKL